MKKNLYRTSMACLMLLATSNALAESYIGTVTWSTNAPMGRIDNSLKYGNKLRLDIIQTGAYYFANGIIEFKGGGFYSCSGAVSQREYLNYIFHGNLNCGEKTVTINLWDNINGTIATKDSSGNLGESFLNLDNIEHIEH